MQLTDHDLKQINQEYLASLSPGHLLHLSSKMLTDLRDARDRLHQTPQNSSRPVGSYAPWEQAANAAQDRQTDAAADAAAAKPEETAAVALAVPHQLPAAPANEPGATKRKLGKQPGAKGLGREVPLAVTGAISHKATVCAGCGGELCRNCGLPRHYGALHVGYRAHRSWHPSQPCQAYLWRTSVVVAGT